MGLVTMPNGEVVDLPDDITPEGLARVKAQNMPTRAQRVASGQPRKPTQVSEQQRTINRRADLAERMGSTSGANSAMHGIMDAVTFGQADRIGAGIIAGTKGVYRAIRDGDAGQIGDTYNEELGVQQELMRRQREAHPVLSVGGELTGAMLNPVGTGAKAISGAARAAKALGSTRTAKALSGTAPRLANAGPISSAVVAGGLQGGLNAAGHSDNLSDVPENVALGGALGALTGGVAGAATHVGGRGYQILKDSGSLGFMGIKGDAERVAYSRIAKLLENGGKTPAQAAREIAVTDARGGDAMVQDLTPGLRAQAAHISRKPSVRGSNELIERGETRIQDRREKFGEQVRNTVDPPATGTDAMARADALAGARKAHGQSGYAEGGVMDTKINPTPELQTYLRDAPEEVQGAMRGAYREMLLRDQKPGDFVSADGVFTHIPNLRTFDYVKRGFDQQIGQAIRSGDKATAQGLSYQLDKLKGVLADANPGNAEYAALLAGQRDLFKQQGALETGQSVIKRMGSEPRVVLKELRALNEAEAQEARTGIIDALVNMDNKADPVGAFRTMMRNTNQRKVMEFAFGGKGNLGRFDRWVNREVRATRADVLTAPGRQSETSRIELAAADGENGAGSVLFNAFKGFGYGGPVGAVAATARKFQDLASGTTRLTQEEIAKILLSKGENLVKGTEQAALYQKAREAGNRRRARSMGKAAQQVFTTEVGGR